MRIASHPILRRLSVAAVAVLAGGLVVAPAARAATPLPKITSVRGTTGRTAGGTKLTVLGTGFTTADEVAFGGGTRGTDLTVVSSTKLTVVTPEHPAGQTDLRVENAAGVSQRNVHDRFTFVAPPTVTAVSPDSGPAAGGARVTVTGTDFTKVSAVRFAAVPGTSVTVTSSTSLTVTSPQRAAGTVHLVVATAYGTSSPTDADEFTYTGSAPSKQGVLSLVAGVNRVVRPGRADAQPLGAAGDAVDENGNLYVADDRNDVVEKIDTAGRLTIVAGEAGLPGAATPGPATSSRLNGPTAVAIDPAGDVYIADDENDVVEKVTPTGQLSIVAGRNGADGSPTAGPATASSLSYPDGVALDSNGNLFIADFGNDVVEKVTPAGSLSIVAGKPGRSGRPTPGPATNSALGEPGGVAVDAAGDLYVADGDNSVILKVTPAGTLSVVAGQIGKSGAPTPGPATSSTLRGCNFVTTGPAGAFFVSDQYNGVVEKVSGSGALSIVAGVVGARGPATPGPATSSTFAEPEGIVADPAGDVFVADGQNGLVEQVTPAGQLSVFAGRQAGPVAPTPGPATSTAIGQAAGAAVAPDGTLYVADEYNDAVEKVTPDGTLSVIAGQVGQYGTPTAGPAVSSHLGGPSAVALDAGGTLYIADPSNNVVEKVLPDGTLSVFAGKVGQRGLPTPGPAASSKLGLPEGLSTDADGNLYIADDAEDVIEKVTPAGALSIAAGTAGAEGKPTPGPATQSKLGFVHGVAVDPAGGFYIADAGNDVVEHVSSSGVLSVFAGKVGQYDYPTPGPAVDSSLGDVASVATAADGTVFVADPDNEVIEKVDPAGTLSVAVGQVGKSGLPRPGAARSSLLDSPGGVAVSGSGELYVADTVNSDVEKVVRP